MRGKKTNVRNGDRFGLLTVTGELETFFSKKGIRRRIFLCTCDCGNQNKVLLSNLVHGHVTSCGAKCRNKNKNKNRKRDNPLYHTWTNMKDRCVNKNNKFYHRYGYRGISVCNEWATSFENFIEDMGDRPKGTTLDRIDVDKGYSKDNCRWATQKEQQNNRTDNLNLTYNGHTLTCTQWAEKIGINTETLRSRIKKRKWSVEKAIETPFRLL